MQALVLMAVIQSEVFLRMGLILSSTAAGAAIMTLLHQLILHQRPQQYPIKITLKELTDLEEYLRYQKMLTQILKPYNIIFIDTYILLTYTHFAVQMSKQLHCEDISPQISLLN